MANHDALTNKPKKPRALTTKQKKFIKGVTEGKTKVQAAMDAYPKLDYKSASVVASQNLNKLSITEALEKAYERQGITIDAIVKPVADGLKAERTVIIGKDNDAFADQVPDHAVRLKAAGMAAMWMGIGKDKEGTTTNYNFLNVTTTDKDAFNL